MSITFLNFYFKFLKQCYRPSHSYNLKLTAVVPYPYQIISSLTAKITALLLNTIVLHFVSDISAISLVGQKAHRCSFVILHIKG